jgi:small GTP-binding protein
MEIYWGKDKIGNAILLSGNPILKPPIELAQRGKSQIENWIIANKSKLNEIKIILLGDPKAGKTSLLRRLKDNTYNEKEAQTDGVNIDDIRFGESETFKQFISLHKIVGHFWDFGGQEIMNATHQFFLTNRSIYVLVLDARKDTGVASQIRQWVKRIKATGGNSPIIVIANQIDVNTGFGFENTFELQNEFPQIKSFITVSCLTGERIDELKRILEKLIPTAEFFNTEIDERWIKIKEKLQKETRSNYFLNETRFKEICREYGIYEKAKQKDAINFLHDLGLVLHFDDMNLAEYFVLDPYWITYGVYQIVTSSIAAKNKGVVSLEELEEIVNEEKEKKETYHPTNYTKIEYSNNQRRFLVDILNRFKLCFYLPDHNRFIIPDLLDTNEPNDVTEFLRKTEDSIRFVYEYEYLSKSTMPFIMVEMHSMILNIWRTGCVLQYKECKALVSNYQNRILLTVKGEYKIKREFMAIIRHIIDLINNKLSDKPKQFIPLPSTNEFVDYDEILTLEKSKISTYNYYNSQKRVIDKYEISKLLEGVPSLEEVSKMDKILKELVDINRKIDFNFQYLIEKPENNRIKDEIISTIKEILTNQKTEITDDFMKAFLSLESCIDNSLKDIYSEIKETDNMEIKLKLAIPFINLLGISFETEFDLKNWAKKMYEKYKLNIFNLMGVEK